MASLLSLLGGNSGTPFTLTDEEAQQLADQQQQANQTGGLSALLGTSGDSLAPQDVQPDVSTAEGQTPSLLNSLGQADSSASTGSDANPSYSTDSQKADNASAQTVQDDATAASTPSTSADATTADQSAGSGSTDATSTPSADASTDDGSTTGAIGKFLGKIASKTMHDPFLFNSLMAAGAGMMAHSNYGTSAASAIGQGAQAGMQNYQAMRQQAIANQMAGVQYQRQAAMTQADIDSKYEETRGKKILNDQTGLRQSIFAQIQTGKLSPNDPRVGAALASTGMKPDEITSTMQGWAPELGTPSESTDSATGKIMVQDRTKTGQPVGQPYLKGMPATPVTAGTSLVNTQVTGADGAASTVATGGVPEAQQKSARESSDKAADAKTTMDMSGQAIEAYNDPNYQKLMASGLAGKAKAYLQSKYSMATDPMAIIDAQINDLNKAKTLTTVLGSGIGKLDKPIQSAVMDGSLDVRSLPAAQKLQIAQMIYNQSKDSYARNSRAAAWDSNIVGNSVSKDTKLPDGTMIKGGTTRDQHIMGTQQGNQLGLPTPKSQQSNIPAQAQSAVTAAQTAARNGDKGAQAALQKRGLSW